MFRIHYASRLVTDARPAGDPGVIVRSTKINDTFSRYDNLEDAYRQAVNDMFYGKVVLGIEDENQDCKVVITAQQITAEVEKMNNELGPSWKMREWKDYIHGVKL